MSPGYSPIRIGLRSVGLAVVVALTFSCARARVRDVQADVSPGLTPPGRVVVFDFDAGGSDVRVGGLSTKRRGVGLAVDEADVLAEAVADALASRLVEDVRTLGLVAERANGTSPPAANDLVIQGRFLRIDEGSKVKRFVIGFGAGATELRTQVEIFQVTSSEWRPLRMFETVAQGSKFPGAAFGVAGGAAVGAAATAAISATAVGVVNEVRTAIEADARRTSEQIAAKVSGLKTAQRW